MFEYQKRPKHKSKYFKPSNPLTRFNYIPVLQYKYIVNIKEKNHKYFNDSKLFQPNDLCT